MGAIRMRSVQSCTQVLQHLPPDDQPRADHIDAVQKRVANICGDPLAYFPALQDVFEHMRVCSRAFGARELGRRAQVRGKVVAGHCRRDNLHSVWLC